MSIMDVVKNELDKQLAAIESEVGTFLQQKSRILALAPSISRQTLLNTNAEIKERSGRIIGEGQALKSKIDSFSPFNFSQYKDIGRMTTSAKTLAQDLLKLKLDMSAHKRDIDAAASSPQAPAASPQSPSTALTPLRAGVAVVVGWLVFKFVKGRK